MQNWHWQNFLQPLLDKLSHENKNIILLCDFNIYLLHYKNDKQEYLKTTCIPATDPHRSPSQQE